MRMLYSICSFLLAFHLLGCFSATANSHEEEIQDTTTYEFTEVESPEATHYNTGYVVLNNEKPLSAQVTKENAVYVINSTIDIGKKSLLMPNGCVLKFDGGRIASGTLIGQNTVILADPVQIFGRDVQLEGSWSVMQPYGEWFGARGDGKSDDSQALQKALNCFSRLNLLPREYRIHSLQLGTKMCIKGYGPYQSKLLAFSNKEDGLVIKTTDKRTQFVEIEDLMVSGFRNGIHFTKTERCQLTNVVSNNCAENACLTDGGCWIMIFTNCKFHNSMTGFSCGLDKVITSTYDFHSCYFYENTKYGFDGVCNNINFYGGYSELNGISGMRFNIKRPSLNVLFEGFDMEQNNKYGIDFSTDDKPSENTAYVVNFHYIGGQIEVKDDGTDNNANIYFGGPNLSSNYWINVNFNTRVCGKCKYVIQSLGDIAIEGSMQVTTNGKKWTTSHGFSIDPVSVDRKNRFEVDLSKITGMLVRKKLIIEPNQQVQIPMGSLCSLDDIKIEGSNNTSLQIIGAGIRDNQYETRASMMIKMDAYDNKTRRYYTETKGFGGVRGIRGVYIKNTGKEAVEISSITLTGQMTMMTPVIGALKL